MPTDTLKPTKASLDSLILQGSKHFALREYDQAAESFADACQIHSQLHNGQDSPALLFFYGRALFQVAVAKSDVLAGGKSKEDDDNDDNDEGEEKEEHKQGNENKEKDQGNDSKQAAAKTGFQFEEDDVVKENETQQKDQNGNGEQEEQDEEEQSDLEVAWEILDTSRALFLTAIEEYTSKGDKDDNDPRLVELEKGLAETFDVLGEVSLENENFEQASIDFKSSLDLKKKHYEPTSSLISEAHFKLSLAYEFCVEEEEEEQQQNDKDNSQSFKDKAVQEMQLAVDLVRERAQKGDTKDPTLLQELESKLADLKAAAALDKETRSKIQQQKNDVLKGISGNSSSSASASATTATGFDAEALIKAKLAQAISATSSVPSSTGVNDLSGLIRKGKKDKKKAQVQQPTAVKRKLEEEEESTEKKAKTD